MDAVEAIFEAAGQLIDTHGLTDLTIGRMAEVAGYGPATVYDYFPTKKAVLIAMARRELDRTFQSIEAAILSSDAADNNVVSPSAIRAMIGGFGGRQRLRGVLLGTMIAEGHGAELAQPVEKIVALLAARRPRIDGADIGGLKPEQLYVLTRALVGVIRAWAMEGANHVSGEALEIELTRMAHSYVQHCLTPGTSCP
jgi:AcrR family transcriptional regulator